MYWNTKTSGSLVVFFVQIFILLALFQGSSLAFHRRRAAIHGRDRSAADMVGPPSPTALKRNININNNGGEYIVPQPVPPPFHPNGPMPKAGNSPPKVMRIVQTVEVGNTQREGDQQQALAMPANGAGHASGPCGCVLDTETYTLGVPWAMTKTPTILTFRLCDRPFKGTDADSASLIFKAMDEDNQRCVAVKILNLENVRKKSDQDAQRTQFAREGTVLSTFERVRKHSTITFDHVIRLFASGKLLGGKLENKKAIVEELGLVNLEDYWRDHVVARGEKDGKKILHTLKHILDALLEFHEVAFHLDVKPRNLMYVEEEGANRILKLIDFGGVELKNEHPTIVNKKDGEKIPCIDWNIQFGTGPYMSPEHLQKCEGMSEHFHRVSEKSDIWGLGVTLFQLVIELGTFPIELANKELAHPKENVLKWRNSVSIIDKQGRFLVKFVDRNKQKPVPPPAVLDARAAADDEIDDLPGLYLGGGDVSPKAYKNRHITEIDVSKITKYYNGDYVIYFAHFLEIIKACLQFEPERRPTAKGIMDYLKFQCRFPDDYVDRFDLSELSEDFRYPFVLDRVWRRMAKKPLCEMTMQPPVQRNDNKAK